MGAETSRMVLRRVDYIGTHPSAPRELTGIDVAFEADAVTFLRRRRQLGSIPWQDVKGLSAFSETVPLAMAPQFSARAPEGEKLSQKNLESPVDSPVERRDKPSGAPERPRQRGNPVEYLIINHSVEVEGPAPGTPEFGEMMGKWMAYNQMLIDNGHWIGGASLAPSSVATSVAKSGDSLKVTDGPFAETKEQIGGYYVIKADDLDEAIRLAQAMPADDVVFELRPIAFRPDA